MVLASRACAMFWDADMWEKGVKEFLVMDADVEDKEVGDSVFSGMEAAGVQGRDWKDWDGIWLWRWDDRRGEGRVAFTGPNMASAAM